MALRRGHRERTAALSAPRSSDTREMSAFSQAILEADVPLLAGSRPMTRSGALLSRIDEHEESLLQGFARDAMTLES